MPTFRTKNFSLQRAVLATLWACFPAFLFYLLILQLPFVSKTRLAISALLIPFLAFVAYRSISKFQFFPLKYWLIIIIGSGILASLEGTALSFYSEKNYLFSSQHTLKIEIIKFINGQALNINRFQTSLGDISYDSFQANNGWKRKGTTLTPISTSPAPLIWTGWTGESAKLYFSGSPGVVVNVIWDGESTIIDLGQTTGNSVVQQGFAMPLWGKLALMLILWGAILYAVAISLVNSQNNSANLQDAFLPEWLGYIFLIGFICSLIFLVLKINHTYLELLLVPTLTSIMVLPIYLILRHSLFTFPKQLGINLQKYSTHLTILFSLALAIGIFGKSLWTNWNIIDDHEIMYFLGPDGKLPFSEIFSMLAKTEVGQFGTYPRFRPSYYFLRLLETSMWGAHSIYWHAFRILIIAFALGLFWLIMSPSLGWLSSGLLCAYALTFPYWSDVIGKLGPGETYAVAGLPIYIWGMVNALQRKREFLAGIAIFLGGIICIGSKENFLLLVFPSLYLVYQSFRAKKTVIFFSSLGTLLFALYVGSSIMLAVSKSGTDIYSNPVSPMVRIGKIFGILVSGQNSIPISILIGMTVIFCAISLNSNLPWEKRKTALWAQFWLVVFCFVYLSQLFFYDGFWPTDYRYDFPGLLYIPAAVYVLFWSGQKIIFEKGNVTTTLTLNASIIPALILVIAMKGYSPITQNIDANIKATNEFTHKIENIASALISHKDYALVIESGSTGDYEPILSYDRFLREYGATNELFLRVHGYSIESSDPGLQKELASSLIELSKKGNNYSTSSSPFTHSGNKCSFLSVCNSDYLPLDQLKTFGDRCFSLSLSDTFNTECKPIN